MTKNEEKPLLSYTFKVKHPKKIGPIEMKLFYLFCLICFSNYAISQAIYDNNGQYRGYQQTSPSGVTNTYNAAGQNIGSSQIDNGQTNYYSPNGTYQGTTTTTPAPAVPNTSINTPRQAPQAPVMKGW